jgi:hypothetical protein
MADPTTGRCIGVGSRIGFGILWVIPNEAVSMEGRFLP